MSKFRVEWAETVNLKSGKVKKNVTLKAENGEMIENVGIWNDFPGFAEIAPGKEVAGKVTTKGEYTTLYSETTYGTFGAKPQTGGQYPPKKTHGTSPEAQQMKDLGIKVSSSMSGAINLAIAEFKASTTYTPADLQSSVKKWRGWIWDNWDYKENLTDKPPF